MFFGAPVWPVSWHPPYDGAIQRIAAAGFRGVELIAWTGEVLTTYYTPSEIRHLRRVVDGEGLYLTNFNHAAERMSSTDAGVRRSAMDQFARAIDVAAALGASTITSVTPYPFSRWVEYLLSRPLLQEWTFPIESGLDWTRNYDDYVGALAGCCTRAAEAGLRLAIEPHPYRWVNSAQSMLRLIERTGAANLGFNLTRATSSRAATCRTTRSTCWASGFTTHTVAITTGSRTRTGGPARGRSIGQPCCGPWPTSVTTA